MLSLLLVTLALSASAQNRPDVGIDPFLDPKVFTENLEAQTDDRRLKNTYGMIGSKMTPGYRLLFLVWSCEGKPFRLSQFVRSVEERRILTGNRADDVEFPGKANAELCKRLSEQNALDPNVVNLNEAVTTYLSSANNQATCSVTGFEKWNERRIKGKNPFGERSDIEIFNQPAGIKMKIRLDENGDQNSLVKNGKGKLSYSLHGENFEIPIELQQRGGIRASWCKDFPPFKMLLPKDDKSPLFKGADRDMKVVTHCHLDPSKQQLEKIYREYTIYRVLEASGLVHFKTQLIDMNYVRADGTQIARGPAIFIENQKDAFERMTKKDGKLHKDLIQGNALALSVAEDLVQNADWSKGHNTRDIDPSDNELWVAYDFDLTRLAQGEKTSAKIGRDLSGWKFNFVDTKNPELPKIAKILVSHENNILKAIEDSPLSESDRQVFKKYILKKLSRYKRVAN